jgi:hypothetical protein
MASDTATQTPPVEFFEQELAEIDVGELIAYMHPIQFDIWLQIRELEDELDEVLARDKCSENARACAKLIWKMHCLVSHSARYEDCFWMRQKRPEEKLVQREDVFRILKPGQAVENAHYNQYFCKSFVSDLLPKLPPLPPRSV